MPLIAGFGMLIHTKSRRTLKNSDTKYRYKKCQLLKIKQLANIQVLEAGLEPAQPQWPRDFKSLVSTDSTIRASSV